ncbi:MAG: Hsp20/alpha crystallin family protein [candidate division Zixibacteria bacterium]|nr:Hsp20/alpha crystallin family protein [candidate division Zixibacteria bacterium]
MRNLVPRHGRNGLNGNFESLMNSFFASPSSCPDDACSVPAVDVKESKDELSMTFEMPGMDKGDIKVWIEDNVLTVSGERKVEKEDNGENYLRSEIRHGSFNRSFKLPKYVDAGKVSADYTNGLLVVKIARAEEAKPKEIEININ